MPIATTTLSFDTSGRITKLGVEEGSRVTAGTIICELEAGGADLARSVLPGGYLGSLDQWTSSMVLASQNSSMDLIKAPFDA